MPGHPVIWQPNGHVIGFATTQRGALNVAAKVPISHLERRSATLGRTLDRDDYPDFTPAWFCGPQLITR